MKLTKNIPAPLPDNCASCGAKAVITTDEHGIPHGPEGWHSLLAFRGWELECSKCWADMLARQVHLKEAA